MTQYTIYATAANTVGNIITVSSVGNMFSGLPIVFSGNTFGGITAGATYYVGAVIPGYPTSTITLSSLPGGATYAVSTASGNMTAVFSQGGQQIINTVPPGESLTTAFTAVNVNFDQLFAAGPVNSNIQIANNTILTTNTNGNINLVPNGVGTVVVNASLLPDRANIRNLGSNVNRFSTIYAQYLNVGNLAYTANTINANLIGSVYATNGGPIIVNANTNTITANTISSSGNVTGNYILGNIAFASGTPATYGNANVANYLPTFSGNLTAGNISAAGNISGTYFIGDGRYISNISVSGGTKIVNGNSWANVETANGNVVINTNGPAWTFGTDSSLTAPGNISAIGNVTGDYILGNIAFANGIPATYGNADVANYLPTFSGNLTAGNISASGNVIANIFSTSGPSGNITGANVITATTISASGNVTGNFILGNIAFANGIPATYGNSDVANYLPTFSGNLTAGNVSATGNITGNFILGNIAFANGIPATYGNSNVANYLPTFSGNLTAGNISAAGNITGNYILGNGSQLTGLPATYGNANVANYLPTFSGNLTAGNISAAGNVTGNFILGNIAFANGIPATYGNANVANYLPTFSGNISAGNISATGNIQANYFLGNGSQLTGLPATYGNSNVTTLLAGFGSNTISTTGNITAGNLIGNINITGNVQGTTANVTLVAGSYSYTFDNTGNLTLPTSGDLVFNANTTLTSISNGNITIDPNGTGQLLVTATTPAQFGNTISAAGNITTAGKFVGNGSQLSNVLIKSSGSWTLTTGTNTVSFSVTAGQTYTMWVNGNIPNGIVIWNATVTLTNTNVPAIGQQFGWYYAAGNALVLASIPSQIIGTAGGISNASPAVANSNVFTFSITNNSGSSQTVYYGWTQIS
jgi:hypothetical protein